jgi:hypothetical protein
MGKKREMGKKMWLGAVLVISLMLFQGPALGADDGITMPSTLDFGEVDVGATKSANLGITHSAEVDVKVEVTLLGACPDFSAADVPEIIIPPGQTGNVEIFYTPSEPGYCEDTGTLVFSWRTPFGWAQIGTRTVVLSGTGLAAPEPQGEPSVDLGSVIAFFDQAVAQKKIRGKGKRQFARWRLNMVRRLLVIADREIQRGKTGKAVKLLKIVQKKIDGKNKPRRKKDFVKGEALSELAEMIDQVILDLEYEA